MRGAKRILKGTLFLPAALLVLIVLLEFIGMIANHAASARQTEQLVLLLEAELPQVEIVDRYTETGNTSGTGNHVDMLTAVVFKTDASLLEIEDLIRNHGLDEWDCWIEEMEKITASREKAPYLYPYVEKMKVPEKLEHTYLLYRNSSAPFVDNIEGH